MPLKIKDTNISDWLLSREWLQHLGGDGAWQYAHFAWFDKENRDLNKLEDDYYHPLKSDYSRSVYLSRENTGTYASGYFYVKISYQDEHVNNYHFHVFFDNPRGGYSIEPVFKGYVENLEEIKRVFELLGVDSVYL